MMSDPSSQPTQPLTEEAREEIRDWHNKTRDPRVGALLAELDRLHSWNGLMELLDEHWPEDIFPTLDDDNRRDPGPRIVSLLRWVNTYRAVADGAHAEADRLRAENTAQAAKLKHAEADPVHFAPYGGAFTTCGQALSGIVPWSAAQGDFSSPTLTTRREKATCNECLAALGLDQDGRGQTNA